MSDKQTGLDMKMIGKKLVELREKYGKTQREVAKAIDIAPSTYCSYENGERIPRDDVKIKLASYYKTTVHKLFFA